VGDSGGVWAETRSVDDAAQIDATNS
jgi:hypothetical protein